MKRLATIIATLLVISGCSSISNVSSDPLFSEYIDHELTLNKQVLICKDDPLKTEVGPFISNELVYNVNLVNQCFSGETIGLLPPGSKLHIKKVEKHKIHSVISVTHIYFIGHSHLQNGEPFEFYYLYGYEGGFYEDHPW